MKQTTKFILVILLNLAIFIKNINCNPKQSEYKFLLNKSYELLIQKEAQNRTKNDSIDQDNLKPSQFRLKCDFKLKLGKNNNSKSENDQYMNHNYQIKWFKLDPFNLLILNDYTQPQLDQLNDPHMSDISIYPSETDSSNSEQFSLSSNLIFNYRNDKNSLHKIDGVYLCKLDNKINQSSKAIFYQSVQQISVNELQSNEPTEKIDSKILQQSSTRILIELNFAFTSTKLLYVLTKTENSQVMAKGKFSNSNSAYKKEYFLFETLEPSTNYTLEIYADQNLKLFKKIFEQKFQTSTLDEKNFVFQEYDYDGEIDDNTSDSSLKRIINCDLNIKELDSTSDSLFSKIKKIKSQIVTINYSQRLLASIFKERIFDNKVFRLNQGENFQNFFELVKFRHNTRNFLINYDCLKQFKQLKSSQPLCVFNLESQSDSENADDYDYYDSSNLPISDEDEDNFGVQMSVNFKDQNSILFVSSRCLKNSRAVRTNNGRSINEKDEKNENIDFSIALNSTQKFYPITRTQTPEMKKFLENGSQAQPKQLSSYKKEAFNSIVPTYLAKHMANINNCFIINNREIQFQIESNKVTDNIYGNGKIPPQINRIQFINKTLPYYYYIEIYSSEIPIADKSGQTLKQRYRNILNNLSNLSKFKFKIVNTTQVVKANLSFLKASKNTVETTKTTTKTTTIQSSTLAKLIQIDDSEYINILKAKKSVVEDESYERSDEIDSILDENSSLAERLSNKQNLDEFYVFKVKILSEDNTNLNEFDVNVNCKKMNTSLNLNSNSSNDPNQNDASNSFFGLVMTILCAVIIIIVGCLFCLIMKRKYGLNAPNYLMNFKNNFFLKSTNLNLDPDQNCNIAKKSRTFQYQHQYPQQQYQLEPSPRKSNFPQTNVPKPTPYQQTKTSFSYNYVRLLREKLQRQRDPSVNYSSSISSNSNTKINIDESSNLLKRIRLFFKLDEEQPDNFVCITKPDTSTGTSSSSSSPLVLFSRPIKNNSPIGSTDSSIIQNATEQNPQNSLFIYKEDNDSIPIEAFEDYVNKMHVDGDFGFAQLYEEITNATKAYSFSSDVSLYDCNRCKNRYSNILTYEHSRVKLSHDERDESYGYINANYVDGYQKPNAYIATQGPMPNTFADFWRMILEKNCSIIVMITNVKEKGRIKCDQYWPDEGFEFYGNIQVTHLHTIIYAFYTKRIFTIKIKNTKKRAGVERLVYQYHFTDWPDHGVPYYILPVLSFIKKSARSNPEFGGPIVVHCSAGVGRTGTYIVIDAMMKQIKHKLTVNIHTFLKHIRHQRNYLVQTEEQFIFIYDVLIESFKSGETELNEKNIKTYIHNLNTVNQNGLKLLDRQFELIVEFKPKDYQISAANMEYNLGKNRSQKIIPVNNSRVVLSRKPGVEGSEYINATYLNGCNRQDEFIVTQYPMENTKSSFWQMVWDNNSNQIVVLNSDETDDCEPYWLPIGETMKCDSFSVILREENFDMEFAVRDFLLQSIDEDYEFTCRMITASYWPDSCTPIKSAYDLINKVKLFRLQMINTNINSTLASNFASYNSNLSPVIVQDLLGGYRAATFCALYTFQDLIQLENSCNVYEIAKMYHLKRPNIWVNRANIQILYEAVESLFDEVNSSNQYQFKSYLNMNIENHFNFMYNQSMSLANLPTGSNVSAQSANATLPNLSNKFTQRNLSETIGSKLHSFHRSESHEPVVKSPLKCAPNMKSYPSQNKSMLNDFQKKLPFFQNENKAGKFGANFGTKKARKFMNTMMMKSATFRKALFPLINGTKTTENDKTDGSQEVEVVRKDIELKVNEQNPVAVSLSSEGTVSSAAASSSSTFALSTTAITANESISSTNKTTNPTSQNNSNNNLNKIKTSSEKLN